MSHGSNNLAALLRSFFNCSELRHFIGSLDDGQEILANISANASSLSDVCAEAAAILGRWGLSDADLLCKLQQHRPTRIGALIEYLRLRAADPTTLMRSKGSLEMTASIEGSAVGVYRIHPGQVKVIGRSSEVEIQFPGKLVKLSRLHAWASWPSAGPQLRDLDSKNGTWVNGRRISSVSLHHGDHVILGEIVLLIHEPDRTETVGPSEGDTLS